MKTKFGLLKKVRYFLYTLLAVVILQLCDPYQNKKEVQYKYEVRLSNVIGSDYHYCDSIEYITERHIKLYRDNKFYMDINLPIEVTLRVSNNL